MLGIAYGYHVLHLEQRPVPLKHRFMFLLVVGMNPVGWRLPTKNTVFNGVLLFGIVRYLIFHAWHLKGPYKAGGGGWGGLGVGE